MNPVGLLFILFGMFALSVGAGNWNWFFHREESQPLVVVFGRNGARVVYGVLGTAVVVMGMLHTLGNP